MNIIKMKYEGENFIFFVDIFDICLRSFRFGKIIAIRNSADAASRVVLVVAFLFVAPIFFV